MTDRPRRDRSLSEAWDEDACTEVTPPPQPIDTSKRTMLGVPSLRMPAKQDVPLPGITPANQVARGSVPAVPVDEVAALPPSPPSRPGSEPASARVRLGTELGSGPVIARAPAATPVVENRVVPRGPEIVEEVTEQTEQSAQIPMPVDAPVVSRADAAAMFASDPTTTAADAAPAPSPRVVRGRRRKLFLLAFGPFALAGISAFATVWYMQPKPVDSTPAPVVEVAQPTAQPVAQQIAAPAVEPVPAPLVEPAPVVEPPAPLSESDRAALANVQYKTVPREMLAAALATETKPSVAVAKPAARSTPKKAAVKRVAAKPAAKPAAKAKPRAKKPASACSGLDCL
jgi:hypothetical protein